MPMTQVARPPKVDSMHCRVIPSSLCLLSEFIERLLKPFSAGLREDGVYKSLDKETKHLLSLLKKEVDL